MHPVIHIVSFLIVAISLSIGGPAQLWLAALLLLLAYLLAPSRGLQRLLSLCLRLRWLWLSLLLIYLWFTPGRPLLESFPAWSPTWEGMWQGLWRIGILLLLAAAAHLLMQLHSTGQIVAAIYWLATPLAWLGVSRDRLALRLMLVFELVAEVQTLYRLQPHQGGRGAASPLRRIGEAVACLFQQVSERAETEPLREIRLPLTQVPPMWQWLFPPLLGCAFWWIGSL